MRPVIASLYLVCAVLCAAQVYAGCPAGKIPGDVWAEPDCVEAQCAPGDVVERVSCDRSASPADPKCFYTYLDGPYPECCEYVQACSK
ncbi:hypothetical protein BsWGS_07415 [Bradybaena similaris]